MVDATCDVLHRILSLLFPLELMVWEVMILLMLIRCLFVLSLFASSVISFSVRVILCSKNALSCCAGSQSVWRTCFWVGHFFSRFRFANVLSSLGDRSGGLGVSSMYVARTVYVLGVTILMLLFANFFFKDLLVFFPRTSIHFSSSEPPHRHSSLVSPLSLSLPLLLSSDALLAKPPMSEEYSLRRLHLMSNCLHILLGRHPLYFLL